MGNYTFKRYTLLFTLSFLTLLSVNAQVNIAVIQSPYVLLLDETDGTIVDATFIDLTPLDPGTPKAIKQVGGELWITDQIRDRIDRFDLDGNYISSIGGQVVNGGLDNIKGLSVINDSEVWVTNAGTNNGAPGNSIVRFDFNGNNLGNFLTGSDSSFDIVDTGDGEVYISYIGTSSRIERRDYSGNVLGNVVGTGVVTFIQQINLTAADNVLAAVFSNTTSSGNNAGIYHFSSVNGSVLNYWANSGMRGVAELGNGQVVWTNSSGLSLLDPTTGISTLLSSGAGQYFGTITNVDCPTLALEAPTGNAIQEFCNSATVADLVATGSNIQWYEDELSVTPLNSSDVLIDNESYYATQTQFGCESETRLTVDVSIIVPPTPTGSTALTFCNAATVSDLTATGVDILWYENGVGGTALGGSVVLTDNTTYYASQTISGCESETRLGVTVTIDVTDAPVGDVEQTYCEADGATVADLMATGDNIQWYASSVGGTALDEITLLTDNTTYYASQTISGCESEMRLEVQVSIISPSTPSGDANQTVSVIDANDATLADLTIVPTNVLWYASESDAINGINPLPLSTVLSSGMTYYAVNEEEGCYSDPFAVTVTVEVTAGINENDLIDVQFYPNPTTGALTISHSTIISEVIIHDLLGQQVQSEQFNDSEVKMDLSPLPASTYFVDVILPNGVTKTLKVVKKN